MPMVVSVPMPMPVVVMAMVVMIMVTMPVLVALLMVMTVVIVRALGALEGEVLVRHPVKLHRIGAPCQPRTRQRRKPADRRRRND